MFIFSVRYIINIIVLNVLKIYFWGNYFLNMWNILEIFREIMYLKYFFFFKERIGIFIMFCFFK